MALTTKKPGSYLRKPGPYTEILLTLKDLNIMFPSEPMSNHLATAVADYKDMWGIPNKALLEAVKKYKAERELCRVPEREIDKIIEEGKNIANLFKTGIGDEDLEADSYQEPTY
jgi:hypothetical protein